ncbi:MAG: hypothetical protein QOD92_1056 [Acidimicrobiaceae bacterium]|jgi:integrase
MSTTAAPKRDTTTGLWGFVVDAGTDPKSGKRRQVRRRGFKTKTDALAELDKIRQSSRDHTYVANTRQTLGDYLDEWLVTIESTLRPSTHHSYDKNVRIHVKPHIGAVKLQAVDGLVLNKLYGDLAAKLGPRTIRYVHAILHRAFKDAMKVGRLTRNPSDAATPPTASSVTAKPMATWTGEEVGKFLRSSAEANDRLVALWTFLVTTGVRRGEALGLRWEDVDLDEGRASIVQTVVITGKERLAFSSPKTAAGVRTVDLDPTTVRSLIEHRKRQAAGRLLVGPGWRDHGLVFTRANGDPLDPENVSRDFRARLKRWKMRPVRLHDLRHTWATLALKAGVPTKVVQERLGHSSPLITMKLYQHVMPGMGRDAADLVASMIFGA